MERCLLEPAATRAAVTLPSVIRPADEEPPQASPAAQLEDNELVHPSRRDENWTAISGASTVREYWLSIRRLYMRVQAPTWALLRFTPPLGPTGTCRPARLLEPTCPQIDRITAALASMQQDALDVARSWGAGAASRYASRPGRNGAKNCAASSSSSSGNASAAATLATSQAPLLVRLGRPGDAGGHARHGPVCPDVVRMCAR